jgi:hypothetical protein
VTRLARQVTYVVAVTMGCQTLSARSNMESTVPQGQRLGNRDRNALRITLGTSASDNVGRSFRERIQLSQNQFSLILLSSREFERILVHRRAGSRSSIPFIIFSAQRTAPRPRLGRGILFPPSKLASLQTVRILAGFRFPISIFG